MEQYRYIKRGDKIKGFGFLRVPRSILKETGLSLEAKMLYALMLDRTDWALREGHTDPLNRATSSIPSGRLARIWVYLQTQRVNVCESCRMQAY